MSLKDLVFTDIYLDVGSAWISGVPGTSDPVAASKEDLEEILALRAQCEAYTKANPDREDFPLRHGSTSYRVSTMRTIKEVIYVMRRLSETITPIDKLGIPPSFVEMMMKPAMTGLFIISGTFGQGKTTTASSYVVARISKFGGVAVTVEEPPEAPLHGKHGEGVCYQTWVEQGGFGHACRQAARWAPSIIFLGEIRDAETAIEALRASINGKLVICTAHADNCSMAIERVFALACGIDGSSPDDVLGMLATGLTAVVHQKLESSDSRKQLMLDPLFVAGEDETAVRNLIRQRKFDQLKSFINLQKNRMIMAGGRRAGA